MGDAAVLDPEVVHPAEVLAAEALGPEEVGVALEEGDDVVGVDLREHELLLGPDPGAVGPGGAADAGVEEVPPVGARVAGQRVHVVAHVEEAPRAGAVDDLVERVALVGIAAGRRGEGLVPGREALHGAPEPRGLLADVLLRGAAVLGGRGGRVGGGAARAAGAGREAEVGAAADGPPVGGRVAGVGVQEEEGEGGCGGGGGRHGAVRRGLAARRRRWDWEMGGRLGEGSGDVAEGLGFPERGSRIGWGDPDINWRQVALPRSLTGGAGRSAA